jgi:23S rRNA pseudouridine955/2504/2580 synthase
MTRQPIWIAGCGVFKLKRAYKLKPPDSIQAILLHEDEDYLIVNKPPFLSTLEDRVEKVNVLVLAKDHHSDAQVCHRLDKDTSGVLAIAKNPAAYRHLSMQFEGRTVHKIYHAVSDGIHRLENREVNLPLLKQNDGLVKIAREGKPALTIFNTLKAFKAHTLIECKPVTGRMHQIRVHLAWVKAPITGDETYGGKPFFVSAVKRDFHLKKTTEEQPLIKRMALHAFSLEFVALDGQKVRFEAPYPKDFSALIRQLSAHKR